jgi:drug/metabolite transporter (DMT)-like permease
VGGTICGPVIGVWLYLISIQSTLVGVSSTLMALTPVVMLPIARFYYKEQMSFRVVIGTITALAGAAIIFLVP